MRSGEHESISGFPLYDWDSIGPCALGKALEIDPAPRERSGQAPSCLVSWGEAIGNRYATGPKDLLNRSYAAVLPGKRFDLGLRAYYENRLPRLIGRGYPIDLAPRDHQLACQRVFDLTELLRIDLRPHVSEDSRRS